MFEDRIAALNQANTEKMAMGAMQYDKRTYTVDEIQDISKKSFDEWLDQQS